MRHTANLNLNLIDNADSIDFVEHFNPNFEAIDTAVKGLQDGKAPASHTHDDRYYTEDETDIKLNELKHNLESFYPIGSIIQSTTLDTEAKVIAIYGGTTWEKIEGMMLIGASSDYAVNSTGGSATHTITTAEMPSHSHTQQGTFTSGNQSAGHTHSFSATSGTVSAWHTHSGTTSSNGSHTHGVYYVARGDGGGSKLVLVSSPAWNGSTYAENHLYTTTSSGAHTHSMTTGNPSANHTHSVSGTTGGISANHTHNTTISGSTTYSGSGTAMSIMNPYKAVYIWERTA